MKIALIYLLLINALAFTLMLSDKQKARKKSWRIPEHTLIAVAVLGGSLGAACGMTLFHHKTKRSKFIIGLPIILTVQIALAVVLFSIYLA